MTESYSRLVIAPLPRYKLNIVNLLKFIVEMKKDASFDRPYHDPKLTPLKFIFGFLSLKIVIASYLKSAAFQKLAQKNTQSVVQILPKRENRQFASANLR